MKKNDLSFTAKAFFLCKQVSVDSAPAEICQQLKDPRQNGGKAIAQIIQHVTSDKLVMRGWSPGEGRSTPPLGHNEFAQKMADWARYGAACPK
jgi:hypothetical protein